MTSPPGDTNPSREIRDFANSVLDDWWDEMDDFFTKVEAKREKTDLTVEQVRLALNNGYGYETGDAYIEWMSGEESNG